MAVNENVYGAADIWYPSHFNLHITNKNKLAVFYDTDDCRLYHGVAHNKLSYDEPIDKSISYCGLGTESALSHIGYIYKNNGSYAVREWQDTTVTNFAFFQQNVTSLDMSATPDRWYFDNDSIYHTLDWKESGNYSYNCQKNLQPYTLINPHNQVLCIYVRAYNADTTTPIYCDWSTYKNTYKTLYPNIANVNIVAYINSAGWTAETPIRTISGDFTNTLNANQRTLSYGRLDSYVCEGKNFEMYCYYLNSSCVLGSAAVTSTPKSLDKILFVFATETCKEHVKIIELDDNINAYIEYFDGIEDEIFKTVACFGLYFTTDNNVAQSGTLTHNDMYIGLLDENGIGHGEYLRGADTVNAPQNDYTDMSQSGYDYTKDVDKTKYKNDTQFNTSLSLGAFTKFYQLTESQVNDLCTALYTAVNSQPSGTPIEEYNMKCFLTNNPIDCIISLKKFPLNHFPSVAGVVSDVYLGTVDSGINAPRVLSTTWVYYFDFSNSNDTGLYPVFGDDFRDYEPYTTVQINVPFCGSFEVPTTYFYKYGGVRVALMIDFISGACTAYLIVNGDVVDSVSGACAVDLPVTGLQSATLDGNIHSAAMAEKSAQTSGTLSMVAGAISIGAGIVTGNPLLAIGGVTALVSGATSLEKNQAQIDYDVQHMQLPLKQVGAASGAIAQCGDYRCKMIIKRPVMLNYDDEVYAKTIGYACLLNGSVSNFHGLTYGEIDLTNINCSESEKEMIKSAFASGVYLP